MDCEKPFQCTGSDRARGDRVIRLPVHEKFSFNLVDEVLDLGDALLVRSGEPEERIALADIANVNYYPYGSPPQVTLSLRRPTVFGDTIVFCPPARFMPLSTSPIIESKLVQRIDAARRGH